MAPRGQTDHDVAAVLGERDEQRGEHRGHREADAEAGGVADRACGCSAHEGSGHPADPRHEPDARHRAGSGRPAMSAMFTANVSSVSVKREPAEKREPCLGISEARVVANRT